MKTSKNERCYSCEKIAITQDHIPPRCFFPKKKHLPSNSPDYRKNLITVPSCLEHNNSRSKDDEYLAAIIAMNSESDIAFTMFTSKWVQSLLRREGILGKRIFSTARSARVIKRKNNILIPYETLAITYEINRIYRVIESIARGLFYIESGYSEKWLKNCIVMSPNFLNRDLTYAKDYYKLNQLEQAFVHGEEFQNLELTKKGTQPNIFYYQFFKSQDREFLVRMVFYGDFTFFVFLKEREPISGSILLSI
jgi:hypothetical protein